MSTTFATSSTTVPTSSSLNSAFLTRSPLTPNMSDIRGESPSPKLVASSVTSSTDGVHGTLKPVAALRDSQLMTPPFSPAKPGDTALSRTGDDSLAYLLSTAGVIVDGPLFPEVATPAPKPQPPRYIEIVQGRGIKRKLLEDATESEIKRSRLPGAGHGEWVITKWFFPTDVKRYLESQKSRLARTKLFRPRVETAVTTVDSTPKRLHRRGPSGNIKRSRLATVTASSTPRPPRVRPVPNGVDYQTSTRANGAVGSVDVKPIKVARPRPAPKVVDPNAPPKVSKGQRTDAEFEEALALTASPIYYPPNDNLDTLGPNAMKVEWKSGKKIYSSSEFTRFQGLKDVKFHAKEIDLAGTINMVHLAQYEESKRLIFKFWFERKSLGLSFTKTHAQQAAHVDVNKASALWTAFDKAGWFTDEAFRLVTQKRKSWRS
jgi:hypothetical protein